MIDPKTVPHFTLNSGAEIPCIGMGTFGSDRVSPDDVAGAVAGALRAGYRLLDCAACYGNEAQIGAQLRAALDGKVVRREELFVMTKIWNDMHRDVAGLGHVEFLQLHGAVAGQNRSENLLIQEISPFVMCKMIRFVKT